MKKVQAVLAALLLCTILGASFISCSSDCVGRIEAEGKEYTANARNLEDANRFACNKYCLDTDSECDAMYDIWLNSPKGKAAGSLPKMRALSEDKKLLDCITVKCANRCLADVKAGKLQAKSSCD